MKLDLKKKLKFLGLVNLFVFLNFNLLAMQEPEVVAGREVTEQDYDYNVVSMQRLTIDFYNLINFINTEISQRELKLPKILEIVFNNKFLIVRIEFDKFGLGKNYYIKNKEYKTPELIINECFGIERVLNLEKSKKLAALILYGL